MWVRRFHHRSDDVHPFHLGLLASCRLLGAVPVTIQDSSFTHSDATALARGTSIPILVKAGAIAAIKVGIPFSIIYLAAKHLFGLKLERDFDFATSPAIVIGILALLLFSAILWTVIPYKAIRRRMRRLGFTALSERGADSASDELIRRVKEGDVYSNGVEVLRCEESFWQRIVKRFLTRADAVVIDVTDLSPNVLWEIETAFQEVPGERILLVHRDAEGSLPPEVAEPLERSVSVAALRKAHVFAYRGKGNRGVGDDRRAARGRVLDGLTAGLASCFAGETTAEPETAGQSREPRSVSWRRRAAFVASFATLAAVCALVIMQQVSKLVRGPMQEEIGLWQPLILAVGLAHILATVRLVTYLPRIRPKTVLVGVLGLLLLGYVTVAGVRIGFVVARMIGPFTPGQYVGFLKGDSLSIQEGIEAIQSQMPKQEEIEAMLEAQQTLAESLAVWRSGSDPDAFAELYQRSLRRARQARGLPSGENDGGGSETGEDPTRDEAKAEKESGFLDWLGGNVAALLHLVGIIGFIQAVVSWKTNRELTAAHRSARRLVRGL